MSEHDFTQVRYWLDLMIKALIGVVVSMVGLDYRQVKNSLKELQEHRYTLATEEQILRVELKELRDRLERIDNKIDKALIR